MKFKELKHGQHFLHSNEGGSTEYIKTPLFCYHESKKAIWCNCITVAINPVGDEYCMDFPYFIDIEEEVTATNNQDEFMQLQSDYYKTLERAKP